jgi:hypothetical protein
MARANNPNTANATATRIRIGLDNAAGKLRAAGYKVFDPEQVAEHDRLVDAAGWLVEQVGISDLDIYWAIVRGFLTGEEADTLAGEEVQARVEASKATADDAPARPSRETVERPARKPVATTGKSAVKKAPAKPVKKTTSRKAPAR